VWCGDSMGCVEVCDTPAPLLATFWPHQDAQEYLLLLMNTLHDSDWVRAMELAYSARQTDLHLQAMAATEFERYRLADACAPVAPHGGAGGCCGGDRGSPSWDSSASSTSTSSSTGCVP
jgi:hypothetical protein